MSGFSQAGLWALLDTAEMPFRTPLDELIATYGTIPSGWGDRLSYVPLPGVISALPPLAAPFAVVLGAQDDLTRPPMELVGYVRGSDDARKNFSAVCAGLKNTIGLGRATSVSNTVAASWGGRYCRVTATAFPPELNRFAGHNKRHDLVPGSKSECSIRICPDWWPHITSEHVTALEGYIPDPTYPAKLQGDPTWPPLPEAVTALPGIGFSGGDAVVAVSRDRRFLVIPSVRIDSVSHDVLTPAKGSGGSWIVLRYRINDLPQAPTRSLSVLSGRHDDPQHRSSAQSLASHLGMSLATSSFPDA